ncbi:MAG: histidine--tRNA ligase [Bifidobacteriaceae bacterium]|jgi:histidyl-tRNA synthetase|nr:histidine--tRNA ligase [Bifidobacteriaceae bacterium]
MARVRPLSGFPEWLPAGRAVEAHVIGTLTRVFELHSFSGIETRAVEPLGQLLRKGETSKEVYVLRRLQDTDQTGYDDTTLGLHFDLTVPLARYVLENAGQLDFPFKRYQIQKVWRGERPQEGRFREFIQADIDVIGQGTLPFHYEVELPLVMAEALSGLGVGAFTVLVNNRKVAEGFYRGLGLADVDEVLRWIDKLDKAGPDAVREGLLAGGATGDQASACLELAGIAGEDAGSVTAAVRALAERYGAGNELLDQGLGELAALLAAAAARVPGTVRADLKIARGLDYYTGSVYETVWRGHESLGSICSGGRYDSLASDGSQTYPGVGLSIGVSRLVSRIIAEGLLAPSRTVPACVVVAVDTEDERAASDAVAARLRARGIPTDVAPTAAKYGKQIKYADKRGVPYVWFLGADGAPDQVKDIRTGEQVEASADVWTPPPADLSVSVGPGGLGQ